MDLKEDKLLSSDSSQSSRELLEVCNNVCFWGSRSAPCLVIINLISNAFHIVAGMSAGLPKYIVVNLKTLSEKFSEGEEVSLDTMSQKRILNLSGREAKLPLKVG